MSMNSFELQNPTSIKEAIALLDPTDAMNRKVRLLAGGQDLLTEMKDRLVEPERVVNLKYISGLDKLAWDGPKGLTIGGPLSDFQGVLKGVPTYSGANGPLIKDNET